MPNGNWVWYDLKTTNIDAACDFYSAVAGYTIKKWEQAPEGMPPYKMLHVGDRSIGGVMDLPEEAKSMGAHPHWLSYIQVSDLDATLKAITADGAKIYAEPMEIPSVGRFAVASDPQGAVFAMISPVEDMAGRPGEGQPGDVMWAELSSTDEVAGLNFYKKHFGWVDSDQMDMGPMGTYYMYKMEGDATAIGGAMKKPDMMPVSAWLYYLKVPNVNEAVATVEKLGGKLLNGPNEVPGGEVVAQCMDPQGAAFAIVGKGKVN